MRPKGFTLIELLVVVAIISLLVAISIPIFKNFIVKAKRSEAVILITALRDNQTAYFAANDEFYPPGTNPGVYDFYEDDYAAVYFNLPLSKETKGRWFWIELEAYGSEDAGYGKRKTLGYAQTLIANHDPDPSNDTYVVKNNIWGLFVGVGPTCPNDYVYLVEDDIRNTFTWCN